MYTLHVQMYMFVKGWVYDLTVSDSVRFVCWVVDWSPVSCKDKDMHWSITGPVISVDKLAMTYSIFAL